MEFCVSVMIGLYQKKIVPSPPVEDINFFEVDPLDFQSILSRPPGIFHFFPQTPFKSLFFPQILTYPLEFQLLSLYPPGNFRWYPQQGGFKFFLEKARLSAVYSTLYHSLSKFHGAYITFNNISIYIFRWTKVQKTPSKIFNKTYHSVWTIWVSIMLQGSLLLFWKSTWLHYISQTLLALHHFLMYFWKLMIISGFFQKKMVLFMLRISIFSSWHQFFNFIMTPRKKFTFIFQFLAYLLEISIDILNREELQLFSEKAQYFA